MLNESDRAACLTTTQSQTDMEKMIAEVITLHDLVYRLYIPERASRISIGFAHTRKMNRTTFLINRLDFCHYSW